MKLIVGLGNPGAKYDSTRHNIGKRSVLAFAETERLSFVSDKTLKASICQWESSAGKVLIVYPDTYMNLSGEPVRAVCDYYKIESNKDILVISDDVALPFGTVRFRAGGSAGGHNGLKSIEQSLGHQNYARLKVGVGEHINACDSINDFLKGRPLEDFVLEKFSAAEEKTFADLMKRVGQACRLSAEKSFEQAASLTTIKRDSN